MIEYLRSKTRST